MTLFGDELWQVLKERKLLVVSWLGGISIRVEGVNDCFKKWS